MSGSCEENGERLTHKAYMKEKRMGWGESRTGKFCWWWFWWNPQKQQGEKFEEQKGGVRTHMVAEKHGDV